MKSYRAHFLIIGLMVSSIITIAEETNTLKLFNGTVVTGRVERFDDGSAKVISKKGITVFTAEDVSGKSKPKVEKVRETQVVKETIKQKPTIEPGRIGSTANSLEDRFGIVITNSIQDGIDMRRYLKKDFYINVFVLDETVELLHYTSASGNSLWGPRELSSDEIHAILNSNAQGFEWKQFDAFDRFSREKDQVVRSEIVKTDMENMIWTRKDGVVAIYSKKDHDLTIKSARFMELMNLKSKSSLPNF